MLEAVDEANDRQKRRLFEKLRHALNDDLRGARVAVWGLSFKPQTDDMRESPALTLIDQLARGGRAGRRPRSRRHATKRGAASAIASSSPRATTRRSTAQTRW